MFSPGEPASISAILPLSSICIVPPPYFYILPTEEALRGRLCSKSCFLGYGVIGQGGTKYQASPS